MGIDQSSEVVIDLQNLGNGPDSFVIEIENQTGLESLGFSFEIQDTDVLASREGPS